MTKLVVKIEAAEYSIDLDDWKEDYFDEEEGVWDMDGLYDGFVHEIITQPDYTVEVIDKA